LTNHQKKKEVHMCTQPYPNTAYQPSGGIVNKVSSFFNADGRKEAEKESEMLKHVDFKELSKIALDN